MQSAHHSSPQSTPLASAQPVAPGWWQLVAAGEPFRLLFPLGTVLGLLGISLWPLYVYQGIEVYPGILHARIMICGFLTAFVIGFLGTALPRLLDVPRFTGGNAITFGGLLSVAAASYWCGWVAVGDGITLVTLLALVSALLRRARKRKDIPPPGFTLVAMGMLCAVLGTALFLIQSQFPSRFPAELYSMARLLLYQGYLLLPIMGIGAFLLPRFFGLPNRQSFPESLAPPPGWWPRAAFALACGGAVITSFIFESLGFFRLGFALRAIAVATYILREVPVHKADFGGGPLALSLRISLIALPVGYALMAIWPEWMMTLNHIIFITGFSLTTFIVASRVVLGHSGQSHRFRAPSRAIMTLLILMILALLTRLSADWLPDVRLTHYAYAAITWMVATIVWAIAILPSVRFHDSE